MAWTGDSPKVIMSSLMPDDARIIDCKKGGFFDGTQAHESLPFEGRRISLVFYVSNALPKAHTSLIKGLRDMKFCLPKGGRGAAQRRPRVVQGKAVPEAVGQDGAGPHESKRGDSVAPTPMVPVPTTQESYVQLTGRLAVRPASGGARPHQLAWTATKEGQWPSHRFPWILRTPESGYL